jgi:DNA-binding response OmpR family regulator
MFEQSRVMATILVIDDDDLFRKTTETVLKRAGFRVLCAADGQQGVELFRAHRPDLVVTDIRMPDKDGFAVIRELRAEFPDVRTIAVSGGDPSGVQLLKRALEIGACDFIAKPVSPPNLVARVRKCLPLPSPSPE